MDKFKSEVVNAMRNSNETSVYIQYYKNFIENILEMNVLSFNEEVESVDKSEDLLPFIKTIFIAFSNITNQKYTFELVRFKDETYNSDFDPTLTLTKIEDDNDSYKLKEIICLGVYDLQKEKRNLQFKHKVLNKKVSELKNKNSHLNVKKKFVVNQLINSLHGYTDYEERTVNRNGEEIFIVDMKEFFIQVNKSSIFISFNNNFNSIEINYIKKTLSDLTSSTMKMVSFLRKIKNKEMLIHNTHDLNEIKKVYENNNIEYLEFNTEELIELEMSYSNSILLHDCLYLGNHENPIRNFRIELRYNFLNSSFELLVDYLYIKKMFTCKDLKELNEVICELNSLISR